jgi:hypothetical protein
VPNIGPIFSPLYELTGNTPFIWNQRYQQTFETSKEALIKWQTIHSFNPELDSEIVTDASGEGVGAMWFQGTKPIAIISRSLSKAERNYTTTEREPLAIAYALKKWRHYVESTRREISLYTDHMNLIQNLNADGSNRRINRWVELTQWAPITYKYVEGKKNPADLPSRRLDFIREEGEGETSSEDEDLAASPVLGC